MTTLEMFDAAIEFIKADLEYLRAIQDGMRPKPGGRRFFSRGDWLRIKAAQRKKNQLEQKMFAAWGTGASLEDTVPPNLEKADHGGRPTASQAAE